MDFATVLCMWKCDCCSGLRTHSSSQSLIGKDNPEKVKSANEGFAKTVRKMARGAIIISIDNIISSQVMSGFVCSWWLG